MKKFFKWAEERMNYISVMDIGFLKMAMVFFGLFLASVFPVLIRAITWQVWLIATVLFVLPVGYRFYFGNKKIKR